MTKIRAAQPSDLPQLLDLCEAHAEFEKATYSREGKSEKLTKALFEDQQLKCVVAEENENLIGYASFIPQFATWEAEYYLYMDCLYLSEASRGKGLGRSLMQYVWDYAVEAGISEIQWQTPDFNVNAIEFYKKLGAVSKKKERFFWSINSEPS